jgi:hypothetical protein
MGFRSIEKAASTTWLHLPLLLAAEEASSRRTGMPRFERPLPTPSPLFIARLDEMTAIDQLLLIATRSRRPASRH